jgi:hypothetical protein
MFPQLHIHKHACSSPEGKTSNEIEHVSIEAGIELRLILDFSEEELDMDRCAMVI